MFDEDEDLIGKIGVIDDADSPYYGYKVRVTEVNGKEITIELVEETGLNFRRAWVPRSTVRML